MSALLALALAAAAFPAEPGRALFDAAGCAACHRVDGRGGNAGPDLSLVGFRRSPEWLRVWLRAPRAWKPDTKMPDFHLRPAELEALVDYLSTLNAAPAERGAPAALERGRRLFTTVGCVACHGPAGAGGHPNTNVPGGVIPALPALAATYTEDELFLRIKNGKKPDKEDPAGPEPLVRMPAWGKTLDDAQLRALALYVKSLAAGAPATDW